MKDRTNTVAPEVAQQEFDRWADAMDLDLDESAMDADDLQGFRRQKRRILRAIEDGSLVIGSDGYAVFTPRNPNSKHEGPITFRERSGASLMAMDGKKRDYDVAKTYAILADMTGLSPKTFAGLVGSDIKICEALFALLMD